MNRNLYDLLGLVAAVCFILALKGLSSPKSARRGNIIGAVGATIGTVLVFWAPGSSHKHLPLILAAIAFGVLVGVPAARRIQMTQMPQLVALFNGVGGGAAALVSTVEYLKLGNDATTVSFATCDGRRVPEHWLGFYHATNLPRSFMSPLTWMPSPLSISIPALYMGFPLLCPNSTQIRRLAGKPSAAKGGARAAHSRKNRRFRLSVPKLCECKDRRYSFIPELGEYQEPHGAEEHGNKR